MRRPTICDDCRRRATAENALGKLSCILSPQLIILFTLIRELCYDTARKASEGALNALLRAVFPLMCRHYTMPISPRQYSDELKAKQ